MTTDTQTAFVLVPRELFTYQRTFDAIAAATSLNEVGIGISVKAFIEAFGPLSAAPKPPESEIGPVLYALGEMMPEVGDKFPVDILVRDHFALDYGYDTPLYPQARIDADAAEKAELKAEVERLQECAVTWEHNWKSERDVKLQCVLHARAAERRAEAAEARAENLERQLRDETAIVDRIWDMLGRPSYEALAGRSIYDLIAELQARAALASKKETVDE